MKLSTRTRRVTTCVVAVSAATVLASGSASANGIAGTAYCSNPPITSASGTQQVQGCVYFEWSNYRNGVPWSYHAVATLGAYGNAGKSKLTIKLIRVQKYYVGSGWYDDGSTNPNYPKSGTVSVSQQMADRSRPLSSDNGCPSYRVVMDFRVDFTSGGNKQANIWGPSWDGACM